MLGPMRVRLTLLVLVASLPFVLWSVLPVGSVGARTPGKIQKKIDRNNSLIGGHKAKERVLTTDIPRQTQQINSLQSDITRLSARQQKLQSSLDDKRAELAVVQRKLREERARLTRLRARLLVVRRALAQRLVELYKADAPDAITVVLESDGFADLLTRADFMERVSRQDSKIMGIVADAKADATATAKRLDTLEKRQAKVAKEIEDQRDEVSNVRVGLVDRRDRIQTARAEQDRAAGQLARPPPRARGRRRRAAEAAGEDPGQARRLLRPDHRRPDQARLRRADLAGQRPDHVAVLRVALVGVLPPGHRHRRPGRHADPRRRGGQGRADAGRGRLGRLRQLHLHPAPGSLSTCYAHQSRFGTSMGAQVSQGQVIGYVGCTGRCFGDHLHFETRINGSVVNPMNYL